MTSANLFKWTVALLAIPAVLLSAVVILIAFLLFVRGATGGIGSASFVVAVGPPGIALIAGALLGIILVGYAIGRRLLRRN